MKLWKKTAALLLCGALLAAPFAGCGNENKGTANANDGAAVMGRYVEQGWELPQMESGRYLSGFHLRPDGKIAVLAGNETGDQRWACYVTDDGSWQEEYPDWLKTLGEKMEYVQSIYFNNDGMGAVAYYGSSDNSEEQRYRIALLQPDNTVIYTSIGQSGSPDSPDTTDGEVGLGKVLVVSPDQEEITDTGSDTEEGPFSDSFYVETALMGDDGKIYAAAFSGLDQYDAQTGERVQSFLSGGTAFTCADGQLVQLLSGEAAKEAGIGAEDCTLLFLDPSTAEETRRLPASQLQFSTGVTMAADSAGNLYVTDASGLYRIARGGDSWEKILDGRLCTLATPSVSANKLIPHGDNEFLVCYYGSGTYQLKNYVYSPDTPTLPDTELTVYSLTTKRTLSQALSVFRQEHPNVLVNLRKDDEAGATGDDARKALNTELLAGKGPDVFVLDDLPLDSYIEKDVLADLSDVVKPMLDAGELLPAVTKTYERDGKIPAVPALFTMPTLWGDKDAIAAADSLEELADYAEQHPDARLFGNMEPEHMAIQLSSWVWNTLVTSDGKVNTDGLERYFTGLNRLYKISSGKAHIYSAFDTSSMKGKVNIGYATGWDALDTPYPEDQYAVANGAAQMYPLQLCGFESVMMPNAVMFKRIGGKVNDVSGEGADWRSDLPDEDVNRVFRTLSGGSGGGLYTPVCVIGVNAAGTHQELAKDFVRAVLAAETQQADLKEGFPVNRDAIRYNVNRHESWYMSNCYSVASDDEESDDMVTTEYPDLTLEAAWPSTAMLQAVADALETLDTSATEHYSLNLNYAMREWITDGFAKCYEGLSPKEAAQWVSEQARLIETQ